MPYDLFLSSCKDDFPFVIFLSGGRVTIFLEFAIRGGAENMFCNTRVGEYVYKMEKGYNI